MRKKGDIVYINKKPYTLGDMIGGGVQGYVFNIENLPKYVIKIFNTNSMSDNDIKHLRHRLEWLKTSLSNTELKHKLALPKGLLDDDLGYVMAKADHHDSVNSYIDMGESDPKEWLLTQYKLKRRYQIIVSLFQSLREVHLNGLIFTDLSPSNVLVHKKENQIVFIDTDNLRNKKEKYLSVLGTPGYMAPEIYRVVDESFMKRAKISPSIISGSGAISVDTDIFSAAVIAFELLTLQHPFIGDSIEEGTAENEEAALRCETDFIHKFGTQNISTRQLSPYYEKLTTMNIRTLFERTFINGKNMPKERPTDLDFLESFHRGLDLIVPCPHCGFENIEFEHAPYECVFCTKLIDPHPTLVIEVEYKETSKETLINKITNSEVFEEIKVLNSNIRHEISRIVLENDKVKSLFLRHFEENENRSETYAQVKVVDGREAKFSVNSKHFKDPQLIHKINKRRIPLDTDKGFPMYEYDIIIESKTSNVSDFRIVASFL